MDYNFIHFGPTSARHYLFAQCFSLICREGKHCVTSVVATLENFSSCDVYPCFLSLSYSLPSSIKVFIMPCRISQVMNLLD